MSLRAQRSNPDKITQKTIRQATQQKGWIATPHGMGLAMTWKIWQML